MKRSAAVILAGMISLVLAKNVIAQAMVTRGVKAMTGVGLKMREVHVGLTGTHVRIRGLQLLNPAGFHEPLMVNMPELVIEYNPAGVLSGQTRFTTVRMDLRELVVVRTAQGFVNLDALRAVQVSRQHNKANSARPLRPASPPVVREFPVNLHERFAGVSNPHGLGALVISRALAKTAVPDLAKLDLKPLQAQVLAAVEVSLGTVVDDLGAHQLAAAWRTKRLFGF